MRAIHFFQITPEEFKNLLIKAVKEQVQELKTEFEPKKPTEYLTRSEVALMLKIDLSTVHNWSKSGKLIPYGIGNRVYFKRDEVEKSIIKIN